MCSTLVFVFVSFIGIQVSETLKLPSYVTPCNRKDPNLNDCVVKSGSEAIPYFLKGDAKYRVPNLDPLTIDEIKVKQGTKQIGLSLTLRKCKLHGIKNSKFIKAREDLEGRHIEWDFEIPKIEIISNYEANGKVLILPITGKGNANITITKLKLTYKYDWVYFKKGGQDYVNITSSKLDYDNGKTYFDLQNLFNGDKFLGDNMNKFLNENWREVTKELGPAVGQAFSDIFSGLLTRIADQVPYDEIYLP